MASSLQIIEFQSPPIMPVSHLFISIFGKASEQQFSLAALDNASEPAVRYTLHVVNGPTSATIILPSVSKLTLLISKSFLTRPEVSEADPGNQKVTQSKVSKLRPAHRNSEVNMQAQPSRVKNSEPMSQECLKKFHKYIFIWA